MKIDNIFFKFLIVISILLLILLVHKNIKEMFQDNSNNNDNVESSIQNDRELMKYCNSKNSLNCDLEKCVYSIVDSKCNSINDNLYTDSERVNEFYKETIIKKGLTKEEMREIIKPTPFLPVLDLFRFKGIQKPGYIFVSEFYGNNTSIALFFQFNEFVSEEMPFITSDNWKLYIARVNRNGRTVYHIEFKFYDDFETYSHPAEIEPGDKFYFLGINLSRTRLTLYLMNRDLLNANEFVTRYSKGETYEFNEELREKIDTRTTSLFIGTDLQREKFFNGYIGKFDISKNQRTINDLKRLSKFFSKEETDYNELDKGSNISELGIDTQRDTRIPSKITLSITLDDNTVEMFWLPPEEGKDSITMYVIIMIIDEKDVKYIFYDDFACQKCYKKIHDLEYNKNYHFNVIGINDNGLGNIVKEEFILVSPVPPPPLIDQSLTGYSKNPDKIACNPDGTYNIGKSCFKNEAIVAEINDNVHDILMDHLKTRDNYNLKPNIQLMEN